MFPELDHPLVLSQCPFKELVSWFVLQWPWRRKRVPETDQKTHVNAFSSQVELTGTLSNALGPHGELILGPKHSNTSFPQAFYTDHRTHTSNIGARLVSKQPNWVEYALLYLLVSLFYVHRNIAELTVVTRLLFGFEILKLSEGQIQAYFLMYGPTTYVHRCVARDSKISLPSGNKCPRLMEQGHSSRTYLNCGSQDGSLFLVGNSLAFRGHYPGVIELVCRLPLHQVEQDHQCGITT